MPPPTPPAVLPEIVLLSTTESLVPTLIPPPDASEPAAVFPTIVLLDTDTSPVSVLIPPPLAYWPMVVFPETVVSFTIAKMFA